jgi:hypothetical protein
MLRHEPARPGCDHSAAAAALPYIGATGPKLMTRPGSLRRWLLAPTFTILALVALSSPALASSGQTGERLFSPTSI